MIPHEGVVEKIGEGEAPTEAEVPIRTTMVVLTGTSMVVLTIDQFVSFATNEVTFPQDAGAALIIPSCHHHREIFRLTTQAPIGTLILQQLTITHPTLLI